MDKSFAKLNELYSQMPDTTGCVGCGRCCKIQHPHCYLCEFINMYTYVIDNWTKNEVNTLIIDCVERYLSNDMNKPCVFLSEDNKCKVYNNRDYNCRAFGMVPKKIYAKHVKQVKKNFPGVRLGLEKQSDCCGSVKPEKFIGGKKLNEIFKNIYELDRDFGVSEEDMANGSTYMTFHDHLLLFVYGNNVPFINQLTEIKRNGTDSDKKQIVEEIRKQFGV